MSEDIKVKPTPIQRNASDVAMELLKLHIENEPADFSVEGLQNIYTKFYTTAKFLESVHYTSLKDLLPEELKKIQ